VKIESYADAAAFLEDTQEALEANEAANALMLGLCLRLARHPERIRMEPCLKTVQDGEGVVLAAIMTPPQPMIVFEHRGDLAGASRMLAQDLARSGWSLPGVRAPSEAAARLAANWTEATGQGHRLTHRRTAYKLVRVLTPPPQRGYLRRATKADGDLAARWAYGFDMDISGHGDAEEARQMAATRIEDGDMYLWIDEQPRCMAIKNRPTRHGVSVSGVYTPPEYRRKGYASACVAELSRLLLGTGYEFCALFADAANPTPNHIYRTIGYQPLCDYDEYEFTVVG